MNHKHPLAPSIHPSDAPPDTTDPLKVVEARLELLGIIRVDADVVFSKRQADGRHLAVVVTVDVLHV